MTLETRRTFSSSTLVLATLLLVLIPPGIAAAAEDNRVKSLRLVTHENFSRLVLAMAREPLFCITKRVDEHRVVLELDAVNWPQNQKLAEVEDEYVKILENHPQDVETLIAVGYICDSLNKMEDARAEAKKKLVNRLNELSKKHGFNFNKVFMRNQNTRWGSCSIKNNINLNMKLLRLPDEMIDYVLLHELVRTKIKNHADEFWSELNRLVGDAKGIELILNEKPYPIPGKRGQVVTIQIP